MGGCCYCCCCCETTFSMWKRCLALFPAIRRRHVRRGREQTKHSPVLARLCSAERSLSIMFGSAHCLSRAYFVATKKKEKVQQIVWLNTETEAVTETQAHPQSPPLTPPWFPLQLFGLTHPKCHPLFSNDTKLSGGGRGLAECGRGDAWQVLLCVKTCGIIFQARLGVVEGLRGVRTRAAGL